MFTYFVSFTYQLWSEPLGTENKTGWTTVQTAHLITTQEAIELMREQIAEQINLDPRFIVPLHFQVLDRQPIRL